MTVLTEVLRKQARYNARRADMEIDDRNNGEELWGIYDRSHRHYAVWFEVAEDFFEKIVAERRSMGLGVCALDVMSGLGFLESLGVEGVVVGLTRDDERAREAKGHKRYWVGGDILRERKRIWKEVDQLVSAHFPGGFNIITLRGVGGMDALTENPLIRFMLFQNMWGRLAEHGVILAETNDLCDQLISQKGLIEWWNQQGGIKAEKVGGGILLRKGKDAPSTLPLNFRFRTRDIRSWCVSKCYLEDEMHSGRSPLDEGKI